MQQTQPRNCRGRPRYFPASSDQTGLGADRCSCLRCSGRGLRPRRGKIGAIAKPDQILFAADLPKTRSGKIMRRLLRDIAEGKTLGDTTTLADPAVVAKLKSEYEEKEG